VQVEDVKSGKIATLEASGVFIYAGLTPNTEFLGGLVPLDARGQIVTDLRMRTRVPGILGRRARRVRPPARDLGGRRGHRRAGRGPVPARRLLGVAGRRAEILRRG